MFGKNSKISIQREKKFTKKTKSFFENNVNLQIKKSFKSTDLNFNSRNPINDYVFNEDTATGGYVIY